MPELPEVETTRRGIEPYVLGRRISSVVIRQPLLRWPVPADLPRLLRGRRLESVRRRAKYLLLGHGKGHLIVHLGMSGSLRLQNSPVAAAGPHDHLDFRFGRSLLLRYNDPRRFGAILHTDEDPLEHPLLAGLGPEPLGDEFDGDYLYRVSRGRSAAVKQLLMNGKLVVGVGNIYANEALFRAGIRPQCPAGRISKARYTALAEQVRAVLSEAIAAGGTTLRDFADSNGRPGYFRQALAVYGRGGEDCPRCGTTLRELRLGQRATVFCPSCQR